MAVGVLSYAFVDPNQSGRMSAFGVNASERYTVVSPRWMQDEYMFLDMSSATVFQSSVADSTLVLFSYYHPEMPYEGPFLQITNRRDAGPQIFANLPAGFDNRVTSMFVMATSKGDEVRLSFRTLFFVPWVTIIDGVLAGSQAKRDVDPILAWEMFPEALPPLDPSLRYLKVTQPLRIELAAWPDYSALLQYHIFLFLDSGGRLRGWVARWHVWVESGVKHDSILAALREKAVEGVNTLNGALAAALGAITTTFTDLYFLPGNQLERAGTGLLAGNTYDDVTIVLQR